MYYAGALSYADDIKLYVQVYWVLNKILKNCAKYRLEIILTIRNQFVLNLEVPLLRRKLYFKSVMLKWTAKVRHLGHFIDTTCIDYIENKSYFIGYVNKLKVNYGKITHNVLIN